MNATAWALAARSPSRRPSSAGYSRFFGTRIGPRDARVEPEIPTRAGTEIRHQFGKIGISSTSISLTTFAGATKTVCFWEIADVETIDARLGCCYWPGRKGNSQSIVVRTQSGARVLLKPSKRDYETVLLLILNRMASAQAHCQPTAGGELGFAQTQCAANGRDFRWIGLRLPSTVREESEPATPLVTLAIQTRKINPCTRDYHEEEAPLQLRAIMEPVAHAFSRPERCNIIITVM